ncbi:phosphoribosyl-AMP cyclohydrolase [Methanosarcinales archaeon]|nr:phosphoribosyl-AMP cyclohydrolase [Methanosarcinales archaeon]
MGYHAGEKTIIITAVAQDHKTGEVLVVAFMDKEALRKTRETKRDYYWSRPRRKLWKKGESSGHEQIVHDILIDCDAIVLKIEQIKGACHAGHRSCFYRMIEGEGEKMFEQEDVYKK